jgi:hypothetical protein
MDTITKEKLKKYFEITGKALVKARKAISKKYQKEADNLLDMAQRYYDDALWFEKKGDFVNAFACLNYSHGWLDAGARLGIFKVRDTKLFVVK